MPNELITPREMAKSVMGAAKEMCRRYGIDEEYFWLAVCEAHPMIRLSAKDSKRLDKYAEELKSKAKNARRQEEISAILSNGNAFEKDSFDIVSTIDSEMNH